MFRIDLVKKRKIYLKIGDANGISTDFFFANIGRQKGGGVRLGGEEGS